MKIPESIREAVSKILVTNWATWAADQEGGRLLWADADMYYALLDEAEVLARWVQSLEDTK